MFWPDGRPRGQLWEDLPLPPFIKDPEARAKFRIEHPGGWQPIGEEMKEIFSTVVPYIADQEDT